MQWKIGASILSHSCNQKVNSENDLQNWLHKRVITKNLSESQTITMYEHL